MTQEKLAELHDLKSQFLNRFPLKSLATMALETYTNLGRKDSFCYWLESATTGLGSIWGSPSYKFQIFAHNPDREINKSNEKYCHDETYSWYANLGNDRDVAYATVRDRVSSIAQLANQGDFSEIDNIPVGDLVKWKIAYLYSNDRLVPIYSHKMLADFAGSMGMENAKSRKISELQAFLMELRSLSIVSNEPAESSPLLTISCNSRWSIIFASS